VAGLIRSADQSARPESLENIMKQAYLITAVGAAFLAGTMFVAAQVLQMQVPAGESRAQGQLERGPGSQPDQKGKQPGRKEQGKQGTPRQGATDQQREPGRQGQQGQSKERQGQSKEKQGQSKERQVQSKEKPGQSKKIQVQSKEKQGQSKDSRREGQQAGQPPKGQTRDGGRSGSVTLTTEQRSRVRQTVLAKGPRASNINFTVNVGVVVPRTVRVVALDPILIEYYPRYRGYFYFIVGDQIIIVDRRYRIVAIIDV
jgi:hypothetical protein